MLDIGVLFRNNERLVNPFFLFLRKSTALQLRVIAVDDCSSDNTVQELEKYKDHQDIIIRNAGNLGIAKSRNKILNWIHAETGQYTDVLFMDSDIFIMKHESIDRMVEALNSKENIVSVFGKVVPFYNTDFANHGICFNLLSKRVFNEVGVFDERFFHYYDDCDLHHRINLKELETINLQDEAQALHLWGTTLKFGKEKNMRDEILQRDRSLMVEKWKGSDAKE